MQFVSFMMWQDAEQWLWQCVEYDRYTTMERLRSFLTFNTSCQVFRFDDRRVVREVAKEMALWMHKVVIEPNMGQALILDAYTGEPSIPIETETEPELDSLMAELKAHLDAMVAEQQKKSDELDAQLAKMSDAEKAAAYDKRAGKGFFVNPIEGMLDTVKAIPGIYVAGLKKIWGLYTLPSRLTWSAVRSILSGSSKPLNKELYAAVRPLTQNREHAIEISSMLYVLLNDDEIYESLYDFAGRYYDATHPLELTESMAEASSEVAMAIILAIFTAGIGASAKILSTAGRVKKSAKLLKKIYDILKRTPNRIKLPKKETIKNVVSNVKKRVTKKNKGPKVEAPDKKALPESGKKSEKIDNKEKKDYLKDDKNGGPKTTIKKPINPLDDPKIA